jgi:hypothetical protein
MKETKKEKNLKGINANNRIHLQKMKKAGIEWIRMDVKKPINRSIDIFKEASEMGFNIIGVVKSRTMLKGLGFGCEKYLPGSDWAGKWKERAQEAVQVLGSYVKIWQIDNELNHPWHNPIPSANVQLASDIVKIGAEAVKKEDPKARLAVNLFYKIEGPAPLNFISFIRDEAFILKFKKELKGIIDILGMDIYRSTWHKSTPEKYSDDLKRYHDLWEGDVMIMETGFCTGIFDRTDADQANHIKEVFQNLEKHIKSSSWFKGIAWYEYKSKHSGLPCEEFFGLHRSDGIEEKPAWNEFVKNVKRYREYNKILGMTYHY